MSQLNKITTHCLLSLMGRRSGTCRNRLTASLALKGVCVDSQCWLEARDYSRQKPNGLSKNGKGGGGLEGLMATH